MLVENPCQSEIFNADITEMCHCGSSFILKTLPLFLGSICSITVDPSVPCLSERIRTETVYDFIFDDVVFTIK